MDKYNNYEDKVVGVDSSGVELVPENKERTVLVLFNQGSEAVQIYLAVSGAYVELQANQGIHFSKAPINAVNAATSTGTSSVTVWEA